jgi:glyoxylase-like metal-dependent hydrolase (beta-lactamase superfamily II)
MLNQVADGVWVRQSAWVWSNAIAVRGEGGLILVDPGIDGSDLNQLADDLDRLGIPVVAGFSTHPHWDHLLWHPRFGDVPRYATPAGARAASEARERGQQMAADSAAGIPLELIGLVTPLPADGGPVPGEIVSMSGCRVECTRCERTVAEVDRQAWQQVGEVHHENEHAGHHELTALRQVTVGAAIPERAGA